MKIIVNISRIVVGILFIFSGLVKANDPLGLSYKMQEYFEVWRQYGWLHNLMIWLDNYALSFSIIMITLEIVVGVAILIGWYKKFFSLLLLPAFFCGHQNSVMPTERSSKWRMRSARIIWI